MRFKNVRPFHTCKFPQYHYLELSQEWRYLTESCIEIYAANTPSMQQLLQWAYYVPHFINALARFIEAIMDEHGAICARHF